MTYYDFLTALQAAALVAIVVLIAIDYKNYKDKKR